MQTQVPPSLRLLLPLDGSALAEQAIPVVRSIASYMPVAVRLLHAVPPALVRRLVHDDEVLFVAAGEPAGDPAEQTAQMQEILMTESQRYLERMAQSLGAGGVEVAVPCDAPAEATMTRLEHLPHAARAEPLQEHIRPQNEVGPAAEEELVDLECGQPPAAEEFAGQLARLPAARRHVAPQLAGLLRLEHASAVQRFNQTGRTRDGHSAPRASVQSGFPIRSVQL